jgi:branched-chain amino acid aminotransferase
MVENGVVCGLLHTERNDPNAKVVQAGLRETADRMISEKRYYEVLLVNKKGEITEGSRSNVFFLKDGIFITSPSEDVLPGITRQKALEIISKTGMKVIMKSISIDELTDVDGAFLTGTSPKVLPIRKIGDYTLCVKFPEINQMVMAYDGLIEDYIKNNR